MGRSRRSYSGVAEIAISKLRKAIWANWISFPAQAPTFRSERMREAYVRAGLKAELVKVGNASHDFEPISNKLLSISVEHIHKSDR